MIKQRLKFCFTIVLVVVIVYFANSNGEMCVEDRASYMKAELL